MIEKILEYVCKMKMQFVITNKTERVVVTSAIFNLKYKYKLVLTIFNFWYIYKSFIRKIIWSIFKLVFFHFSNLNFFCCVCSVHYIWNIYLYLCITNINFTLYHYTMHLIHKYSVYYTSNCQILLFKPFIG